MSSHGRDQADNAARIVERGAGLAVARTASSEEMHAELVRLISEPEFRTAACALGDAVDAESRAGTLITDLEDLARGDSDNQSDAASIGKALSPEPIQTRNDTQGKI